MTARRASQDQMFFIWRIIEGALRGDGEKVKAYAQHLAQRFQEDGDTANAKRLRSLLSGEHVAGLALARMSSQSAALPVDSESRLPVADEERHAPDSVPIILDPHTQAHISRFLRHFKEADRLVAAGIGVNPSLMLFGPPGTGKTQIARYIASELRLPLLISRADSLISSYLGSTAKNLRLLFEHAASRPCVLFLDEFDAIAKMRDDGRELGELKRVVIGLLQNIDAMSTDHVMIAATNHEHLLDPAIWRRFAYKLNLVLPGEVQRQEMLRLFFQGRAGADVIEVLAGLSEGLSGAQLRDIAEDELREAILGDGAIDFRRVSIATLRARDPRVANFAGSAAELAAMVRRLVPKHITQMRLAHLFGVSQSQISRLSRTEEPPDGKRATADQGRVPDED